MSRTTQDALTPGDLVVLGSIAGMTKGSPIPLSWYDGFQGWWNSAEQEGDEASFEPFELK